MDIKKGSVVTLKSGGPKMTLVEIEGEVLLCKWFYGDVRYETIQEGKFSAASLVVVENDSAD